MIFATFVSFCLLVSVSNAQESINSFDVPTNVTLNDGDNPQFCWTVNAGDGRGILSESAELMTGNDVVDIMQINIQPIVSDYCTNYHFPENLPFGDYTVRVNATTVDATTSTSSTPTDLRVITGISPPMHINTLFANQPLGCGKGQVPGPWQNVSSVNSSSYTSLRLTSPYPGVDIIVQDDPKAQIDLDWAIRDDLNANMNGITNLTFQFLQSDSKTAVGPLITIPPEDIQTYRVDQDVVPFDYGAYKVQMTYYNKFQDGLVAPGEPVSFVSEEFNIVKAGVDCSKQSAAVQSMNVRTLLVSSLISLGVLVLVW